MRPKGTGTIEPTGDGRFRPRLPGRGAKRLDICDTEEEADELLRAALCRLAEDPAHGGMSLAKWGEQVLDAREVSGQRAASDYRSVFRAHVADSWIGAILLVNVTRADVVAWAKELAMKRPKPGHGYGKKARAKRAKAVIARSTAQNALNVLRIVLDEALESELIRENPARGVRLPSAIRKRARTHETWTYLTPAEQHTILSCEAIPFRERLAIAFAIGTGARQTEQWNIALSDLNLEDGTVTLRVTKNGKPRTVPMMPIAQWAAEQWLPLLAAEGVARSKSKRRRGKTVERPELLWPSVRGCMRRGDPTNWRAWLASAELSADSRKDQKHVRWHDLRHTCGTSLAQGWWGRSWSAEEVQVQLDHESVTTTERYVHLDAEIAKRAAREMSDLTTGLTSGSGRSEKNAGAPGAIRTHDLRFRKSKENATYAPLTVIRGASVVRPLTDVAIDVLDALSAGSFERAWAASSELADRVLSADEQRRQRVEPFWIRFAEEGA
jgi:integrase